MNNIVPHVKAGAKLCLFFMVLVISILVLYIRLLFTPERNKQNLKFKTRKQFCKRANWIFGVQLVVSGNTPPDGCFLYVSNHRSFYDPVAFLSCLVANPVSKAEVSGYPIIGKGAKLTEVLMLDRTEKKERRRMKNRIYKCLLEGTSILIYPEGTTSSVPYTDTFKKGAFESTVRAGRPVIPIAMEYPDESYYWTDRSLYQQFLHQMVGPKDRRVYMSVGKPVSDSDPIELLNKTRASIDEQIKELRKI